MFVLLFLGFWEPLTVTFRRADAARGLAKKAEESPQNVEFRAEAPLGKIPGVRLFSLQKGFGVDQIEYAGLTLTKPSRPVDEKAGPFMDTAAMLVNLDLFITSDSAVAHLAGGLGVPTWLVLPFAPDWRWMRDRPDSPRYPNMRLFRQKRRFDWQEVFLDMAEELRKESSQHAVSAKARTRRVRAPHDPEAWHKEGLELLREGKLEEAVQRFRKTLPIKANHVDATHNLAVALARQKKTTEAIASFERVLELKPDSADAHGNLGLAYLNQDNPEKAVFHLKRSLEIRPGSAETINNLGAAWQRLGNLNEAVNSFQKSISLNADYAQAHVNLGRSLLSLGQFEQAWSELEWRNRCPGASPRAFPQPAWDGSPLEGRKIFIYPEQGWSETLLFLRYVRSVRARGGQVIFECPEKLLPLIKTCQEIDSPVLQRGTLPAFDVHASLPSLPGIFGTTLETVPAGIPYLSANSLLISKWQQKLPPAYKAAISWPTKESAARASQHGLIDLGKIERKSLEDTAALLACLDLLITEDSILAQLAGALGIQVWVLLPVNASYYWSKDRDTSPWYPSMRLFWNTELKSWDKVFEKVGAELGKLPDFRVANS